MVTLKEKKLLKAHRTSIKKGFLNFMTPTIVSASAKKNVVFELSRGTDFNSNPVFGATVLKKSRTTKSGFKSLGGQVFSSKTRAKTFLAKQKLKFK